MATIQQRKTKDGSTSYRVQVRLRGYPPATATFTRKGDARAWAATTESAMRDGRHFPDHEAKRRTLAELVDRQLETVKTKRPHDYSRQRVLLGWWKARIGGYALSQVTPALVAEFRDKLLAENIGSEEAPRTRSPATANRHLSALSKAFTNAVREWGWLQNNPLERVSKESEPQGRIRFLSDDERARLLEACRKSELPELYLIVMLALTTGMRRGEILGLRWADIDFERRTIVLHKTKNRERRAVLIVPDVLAILKQHGKVRRLDNDLVFPSRPKRISQVDLETSKDEENSPPSDVGPLWFDAYWYAALTEAGIENFRFHDLRHTAASYVAMSGGTLAEIAAFLGHKTLAMVKRYAHLTDQHTGAVVERMTKKYFG